MRGPAANPSPRPPAARPEMRGEGDGTHAGNPGLDESPDRSRSPGRSERRGPRSRPTDPSIDGALRRARRRLAAAPFAPSTREAALLLAHVLGIGEVELLRDGARRFSPAERRTFEALIDRRLAGEPVAYLTGRREFYGRWFAVDRRALIPRPETEHLIELALELELPASPRILDIGTGSGCIGLTLALERPDARVTATDRSVAALALAAKNARRLGSGERVRLLAADLTAGLRVGAFDLVVSNPPYIDPGEAHTLSPEITRFEPETALYSAGRRGTAVSERLLTGLAPLAPGGRLLVEIGAGQLDSITEIAAARGFSIPRVVADYAGIPRVVLLERRPLRA